MTDQTPLVSVIITTKNSARTLKKCLLSLRAQTYANLEIIIVDNHSTDHTLALAQRLADRVFTAGPERSAQRNFGATKAKGKYLLIHDSDIYFPANTVADCVKTMIKTQADALILPEKSIGEGYWARVKQFERSFYAGNDDIEAARFFTKTSFEKLGGYDEELTGPEDWDLNLRYREAAYKIVRTSVVLEHDEGRINLFGSSKKKRYYAHDMFEKYAQKHPAAFQRQMSFFLRFPPRKLLSNLIFHPILTVSMILMKSLEFIYARKSSF